MIWKKNIIDETRTKKSRTAKEEGVEERLLDSVNRRSRGSTDYLIQDQEKRLKY